MITYTVASLNGVDFMVARHVKGQPVMYRASHMGNLTTFSYLKARDTVDYLKEDRQAQLTMHWREA
jgi:hypothetical protein